MSPYYSYKVSICSGPDHKQRSWACCLKIHINYVPTGNDNTTIIIIVIIITEFSSDFFAKSIMNFAQNAIQINLSVRDQNSIKLKKMTSLGVFSLSATFWKQKTIFHSIMLPSFINDSQEMNNICMKWKKPQLCEWVSGLIIFNLR